MVIAIGITPAMASFYRARLRSLPGDFPGTTGSYHPGSRHVLIYSSHTMSSTMPVLRVPLPSLRRAPGRMEHLVTWGAAT